MDKKTKIEISSFITSHHHFCPFPHEDIELIVLNCDSKEKAINKIKDFIKEVKSSKVEIGDYYG